MQSVLAIAIFLLTLTLVIWQPRGLGIGFSALGGALLALATGVITLEYSGGLGHCVERNVHLCGSNCDFAALG